VSLVLGDLWPDVGDRIISCGASPQIWCCVYIVQTGRSVDIRLKEHQQHIRLEHLDKSAKAEHSIDYGHRIQSQNSSILATKTRYMDRIVKEVIEIELHPYNINSEGGFYLSKSWKPLIGSLKTFRTWPRYTWWHGCVFLSRFFKQPHPPHFFHHHLQTHIVTCYLHSFLHPQSGIPYSHSISLQHTSVSSYCQRCSKLADSCHPDDGGATFLRNVGSYKSHTA
jgi:hypothetical protein